MRPPRRENSRLMGRLMGPATLKTKFCELDRQNIILVSLIRLRLRLARERLTVDDRRGIECFNITLVPPVQVMLMKPIETETILE